MTDCMSERTPKQEVFQASPTHLPRRVILDLDFYGRAAGLVLTAIGMPPILVWQKGRPHSLSEQTCLKRLVDSVVKKCREG